MLGLRKGLGWAVGLQVGRLLCAVLKCAATVGARDGGERIKERQRLRCQVDARVLVVIAARSAAVGGQVPMMLILRLL